MTDKRVWATMPIYDEPPPIAEGDEVTGRFAVEQLQQMLDTGQLTTTEPKPASRPVKARVSAKATVGRKRGQR